MDGHPLSGQHRVAHRCGLSSRDGHADDDPHPHCDALLFTTNYLGAYGLDALVRLGRRIPEHMAVISFDDSDLFRLYSPPITVIAQPMELIAESVINALLTALEGSGEPGRVTQIQLAPQLLVRQSSVRVN